MQCWCLLGYYPFLATSFGAAFLPFADISLTLYTFGDEATCSSPDEVAVHQPIVHILWHFDKQPVLVQPFCPLQIFL